MYVSEDLHDTLKSVYEMFLKNTKYISKDFSNSNIHKKMSILRECSYVSKIESLNVHNSYIPMFWLLQPLANLHQTPQSINNIQNILHLLFIICESSFVTVYVCVCVFLHSYSVYFLRQICTFIIKHPCYVFYNFVDAFVG